MVSVHCVTPEVPHYRSAVPQWRLGAAARGRDRLQRCLCGRVRPTELGRTNSLGLRNERESLRQARMGAPGARHPRVRSRHRGPAQRDPEQLSDPCFPPVDRKTRTAFFGHGRNFQSTNLQSAAERFKSSGSTKSTGGSPTPTFGGYRGGTAGFPREQDHGVRQCHRHYVDLQPSAVQSIIRRATVWPRAGQGSENVGVYISRLYDMKRVPFIIESARRVRRPGSRFPSDRDRRWAGRASGPARPRRTESLDSSARREIRRGEDAGLPTSGASS